MTTPTDPAALVAESKRNVAMLRDARSVLRRVDTLAATASGADDPDEPSDPLIR